jgi:hypothetical protein
MNRIRPIEQPATAPWGLTISEADFKKLKGGFKPQDQDDKWLVAAEESPNGDMSIRIIRAGMAKEFYILHTKASDVDSSKGAAIDTISWDQNRAGDRRSEGQAKKEAVILMRAVLECEFEALPQYDIADLWNAPPA